MGGALGAIGAVAGIAGAGVSAYGQYQGMEAQAGNAAYQSQVAANNALIAKQNAQLDIESGEQSAAVQQMKTRQTVGTTKAQQAAAGIDVNTGSAVDVRAGESEVGMLDALTLRSNAARSAYGQEVAAVSATAQSQLLSTEAQQYRDAAPWAAMGTLLTGASSVGGRYASYLSSS
jgi:hypothetical protein